MVHQQLKTHHEHAELLIELDNWVSILNLVLTSKIVCFQKKIQIVKKFQEP